MSNSTIGKYFVFISWIMFSLQLFSAGVAFSDNSVSSGVGDLVLASFWLLILMLEWFSKNREIKNLRKRDNRALNIFKDAMSVIEELETKKDRKIIDLIQECSNKVAKGGKAKKSYIPAIEKMFHEKMPDRYLKLEWDAKSGKYGAEVSNEPFRKVNNKKKGTK